MKTIRRLYFYAVAFISLEVILWGMISLVRSFFGNRIENGVQTLAQAISLILVGVPIFLVHWILAQRFSATDGEEKTASIRAVFLYGILLATLIPVIQNFIALLDRIFLSVANLQTNRAIIGASQTWVDNLIAIPINLIIAAYFWNVLRVEWRHPEPVEGPETQNFSEIRRLYRFVWVLYGLIMVIFGAQQTVMYIFSMPTQLLGEFGRESIVNAIILLVVGAPIWFLSWRVLQDALPDPAEKESFLRLGILYLLSLGGVITALTAGGSLIYIILKNLLGDGTTWQNFFSQIGVPISIGLPFGIMWAYHSIYLNKPIAFDENLPRRAGKKRLYFYILSLIGLAAAFFGTAMLLSYVIDLLTAISYLSDGGSSSKISAALATLVVGLPVWLFTWLPMQMEALNNADIGDHARRSIVRKSYLYFVIFVAVIGGMAAAVALVFTLINQLLGGGESNFVNSLLNALQMLVLFSILLIYHFFSLRKDTSTRAGALEEKQEQFSVLVFDKGGGKFGEAVKAAFKKSAPKLTISVANANEKVADDLKADAVVLPGSLAMNMTASPNAEAWMRSFNGNRLIVPDEAAGVYWMNDFGQMAESARALAEGQEIRPQSASRATPVWTYVAYVFAALFACELVFILLSLGISMVTGGF
jgi:hypothetical protein